MLVDAIERAGSTKPEDIREALAATEGFQGLGATITMDANRNPMKDAVIIELKDGMQTLHSTVKP
jgi:branched-chain amino acid transport system substrate-binding protein